MSPWVENDLPRVPAVDPEAEPTAVDAFLAAAAGHDVFTEALTLSSPESARALAAHGRGGRSRADRLKLALTVSRYAIRMAARATPFGLLSGVAVAGTGATLSLTVGGGHRKAVRPDAGWLDGVARALENEPGLLPAMRVHVHPLCRRRGTRLTLPSPSTGDLGQSGESRPASVRITPAVAELLREARAPRRVDELTATLCAAFPQLSASTVTAMTGSLLARGFLVSDLRAPAHVEDAAAWLRDRAAGTGAPERLAALDGALRAYRDRPVGGGAAALRDAQAAAVAAGPAHTDLVVDAAATLPEAVRRELARAADVLWRVSPARTLSDGLRRYHSDFIERYGIGRPVPVLDLLDPVTGLDAPATHRNPRTSRTAGKLAASLELTGILGGEVQRALSRGEPEIVLTPALVDALDQDHDSPLWRSFDLTVQVLSGAGGDFTLVCSETGLTRRAGQVLGRFAAGLGLTEELREVFAADETDDLPRQAQIEYRPLEDHIGNVTRVPRLLPRTVVVDGPPGDGPDLTAADIGVCADLDGLYAVSLRDGMELDPSAMHMANPVRFAPNAARLLSDLELLSARAATPWQWHDLAGLPWLPRVRAGRTILSPARWSPAELVCAAASASGWPEAVKEWRAAWRVPDRVVVGLNRRLPLRLDRDWDLRLLREELRREPELEVHEDLASPAALAWSGGRACEITAMVFSAGPKRRRARPRVRVRTESAPTHPFGGEWLYLKLFGEPRGQDALIAEALPGLLGRLPSTVDRWHWLRYPEPRPHLRLRLHGDPGELHADVAPLLREWVARTRDAGLLGVVEAAEYEPEVHRYGAGATLVAAEEVFAADSASVLAQLAGQAAAALRIAPQTLAALNQLRLLHDFGWETGRAWLDAAIGPEARHGLDRTARRQAAGLVDVTGEAPVPVLDGLPEPVRDTWAARGRAVAAYASALRADPDAPATHGVLSSLLHLHVNRLCGPDPALERGALSLVRELVHAHDARRRHR